MDNQRIQEITLKTADGDGYKEEVHPFLCPLDNTRYIISTKPQSRQWRFGLRLSDSEEVPFSHNEPFYPTYRGTMMGGKRIV
jgi:hypothetical protein